MTAYKTLNYNIDYFANLLQVYHLAHTYALRHLEAETRERLDEIDDAFRQEREGPKPPDQHLIDEMVKIFPDYKKAAAAYWEGKGHEEMAAAFSKETGSA